MPTARLLWLNLEENDDSLWQMSPENIKKETNSMNSGNKTNPLMIITRLRESCGKNLMTMFYLLLLLPLNC